MFTTLIAASLILVAPQKDLADRMVELATADQPLVHMAVIDAPVKEVWRVWTTTEGIKKWMVESGEVNLKIGGYIRTSYQKNSTLTGPDTIENRILAFDPERMITIKNVRAPEKFPFKKAMENCWTVIYMRPVDTDKTEVLVRMNGYDHTEESQKMKAFFKQGNQATLDALAALFAKKE